MKQDQKPSWIPSCRVLYQHCFCELVRPGWEYYRCHGCGMVVDRKSQMVKWMGVSLSQAQALADQEKKLEAENWGRSLQIEKDRILPESPMAEKIRQVEEKL